MCGIVGVVAPGEGELPATERLAEAITALRHRGPDGSGSCVSGRAALGHTRLSIIDLEHGDQPMASEDGSVITVYNGEIYNHGELRAELERCGHVFATGADTEVLVHGYEQWGEALVERLDGMFAFAIWDRRAERLLLARDRLGKKPLYMAHTAAGFAFGSDARSVLMIAGRRPQLDRGRVAELLFQKYVGAPRTLFEGVTKLRPGHLVVYERDRAVESRYWAVAANGHRPLEAGELRDLLRDAAGRRLMSDVPLGVLLSGGVDSAAVLGLMNEVGAEAVATFTIGFDDPIYDERRWARLTAKRFGAEHHEVVVGPADFVEALPRLAWFRDEPIAEPTEICLLLLAELAGRHVKVVLTGDGGDEQFGGYPKYRAERLLAAGGPLAARGMRLAAQIAARRPSHRSMDRAAETLAMPNTLMRWASWFRSFSPAELHRLLRADLRPDPDELVAPIRDALAGYEQADPISQMMIADLRTWLPDNMLLRGDKVLMGASVEGRAPLLDRRIVERVASMPAAAKSGLRASTAKQLLRSAVDDLVPGEVFRRPKRGFPVPVTRFLLDDRSRRLERLVLSDRCLDRGLLNRGEVHSLLAGEGSYRADRGMKLFTLASLELWLRLNVDQVTATPPEAWEGGW